MNSSSFKKSILILLHNFEDEFLKSISKDFCDNFEATVEKRDRSIVIDRLRRADFGDERDEAVVNAFQIELPIVELIAQVIKVILDDWPASF